MAELRSRFEGMELIRRSFITGLVTLLGARKLSAAKPETLMPLGGPDYSQVSSREEAARLADKGELTPMRLLPEMFGGDASEANVVFVPPFVVELKRRADEDIIRPLAAEGRVTQYNATPRYSGTSFIPVAVVIHAYDPGDFSETIKIWGKGLTE